MKLRPRLVVLFVLLASFGATGTAHAICTPVIGVDSNTVQVCI